MQKLNVILWPIILIGGLGALVDFLIEKRGQAKVRDFLLKWWVRFDDVHLGNFGREEGFFVVDVIDRRFGKKTWSPRRIVASLMLLATCMFVNCLILQIVSLRRGELFAHGAGPRSIYESIFGHRMSSEIVVEAIIIVFGFSA